MSDLKVMRFETNGPAATGMPEWDLIPAEGLTSGEPVQRGHVYHDDKANGLMVGVWDCTPFTAKQGPYDVNEFMLVLEGSVTIVDERGHEETISAGQSFIIPKGLPCVWKQTEYIRKFFVIHNDASGMTPEDASALAVIRPDPDAAMAPMEVDASQPFVGDLPTQNIKACFNDMTGQMTVGTWDSTPFERFTQAVSAPRADAPAGRFGDHQRRRRRRAGVQSGRYLLRAQGRHDGLEEHRVRAQNLLHLPRERGRGPG